MIRGYHFKDDEGNPTGGNTHGRGFSIEWQNGPTTVPNDAGGVTALSPNGAFVEEIIEAAIDRLQWFNGDAGYQEEKPAKFRCRENSLAITHLEEALHWLQARTRDRLLRGVEGTHIP